jgi:hypothetical protein
MAARLSPKHDAKTREKIQTSQLLNRLQDHANGKVELSNSQVRAVEILLKKTIPDLAALQLTGDPEKPVEMKVSWASSGK